MIVVCCFVLFYFLFSVFVSLVAAGLWAMVDSNFCGFIVKSQDLPTFWVFAYWLSPLHYAFEGIVMTQFHDDNTAVKTFTGQKVTAEKFISSYYKEYSYDHKGGDIIALLVFILVLRCVISLV